MIQGSSSEVDEESMLEEPSVNGSLSSIEEKIETTSSNNVQQGGLAGGSSLPPIPKTKQSVASANARQKLSNTDRLPPTPRTRGKENLPTQETREGARRGQEN